MAFEAEDPGSNPGKPAETLGFNGIIYLKKQSKMVYFFLNFYGFL